MEYTCAACGGEFQSGWSEAEAEAEYINNFKKHAEANVERDLVCDDCYEQMIAWKSPKEAEKESGL